MKHLTLRPGTWAVLAAGAAFSMLPWAASAQQDTTSHFQYDAVGNLTQILDPLGRATNNSYDPLNRMTQQLQPAPYVGAARPVIRYGYDGQDQLVAVTDPRNLVTAYTIDGLGNQTALQSPDTGTSSKTHDAAGNVLSSTDAKGQTTHYQYDALNRVTRIIYADGSVIQYGYDQGNYALGRLTHIGDISGTIGYTYDQKGRLASEVRTLNGVPYVTTYLRDGAGRLERVTYPSGRVLTYTRDVTGRISGIVASKDGVEQPVVSQIVYQPFGGVQSYVNGAGKMVSRSHDLDGRITSYTAGNSAHVIGYDAASRIQSITDIADLAKVQHYGYDGLDRLTTYLGTGTGQSFDYDATGNRINQLIGASSYSHAISPLSNRLNQIAGPVNDNLGYDANGSRTHDATRQYHYDARGRLDSVTTAQGTIHYKVNALGQRVQKMTPTATTLFHYDSNGQLIGESTPQGVFQKEYVYLNDMPVALFQ
jgi:YD repeat-containing protein